MNGLMSMVFCLVVFKYGVSTNYSEDPAIQLFRKYIQINTTTNSDLTPAIEFWKIQAQKEDLPVNVYEFVKGYPVVVIKWAGSNSSLSSIMLNSHMDVVPADENDGWNYPPFDAYMDDNNDIYGRGTQDMKSLAIQQFEALRNLKKKKVSLLRDVYMTLMPDEETGGLNGMRLLLKSPEFAAMKVGVELDEGLGDCASTTIAVIVKDKAVWQFRVDCNGVAAHGSLLLPVNSTAIGKCLNVIKQLYKYRNEQYEIAKEGPLTNAGAFTSVNLNVLRGGSASNVIPGQVSLTFDVRLGNKVDEKKFLTKLNQWISEAGDNVTLTFLSKDHQTATSITNDFSPYWRELSNAAKAKKLTLDPIVNIGSTDGKYLRSIGIPSFGLSPVLNTPLLAHKPNERLNAVEFLKGIDIYEEIVRNIANIPADQVDHNSSVYLTNDNKL